MLSAVWQLRDAAAWAHAYWHEEYAFTAHRLYMAAEAVKRGDFVLHREIDPRAPWSSAVLACEDAGWPIILMPEEERVEPLITEDYVLGAIRAGHRTAESIAQHIVPGCAAAVRLVEMQLRRLAGIGRIVEGQQPAPVEAAAAEVA